MKIKSKDIEKAFGIKLRKHITVLGLDTASKSGYCIAKSFDNVVDLEVGFINVDVSKIEDKTQRDELRYEEIYKRLKSLICKDYVVVIEHVFYGGNAQTLILLSKIGAIAWTIAREKECVDIISSKTAVQARKALNLPCNKKKEIVLSAFKKALKIKISNPDEVDAIILALNGLIEDQNEIFITKKIII